MKEKIIPIYNGRPEDFCWVGFGSGSGTNLGACSKIIKPKLIFCDRPKADLLKLEELADIPRIVFNGYSMCGSWKKAQENSELESEYERRSIEFNKIILGELKGFEEKERITINLIVLGGYMRLVMDPLLGEFKDKIINVHPCDLTILKNEKGKFVRKFVGDNAVYDAIKDRQIYTRSCVIIVDSGVDHGEILVQGPSLSVNYSNGMDLKEYADLHQSMQKIVSDWPALRTALKLISEGKLGLGTKLSHFNEWRTVYINGLPLDYGGCCSLW